VNTNNEDILKKVANFQKGVIHSITPFTTLDFADHLSAIIWFSGCNMRCEYCYNTNIVLDDGKITTDEALNFLKQRVNLIDGVVLSGGEATTFKELPNFAKEVKSLGFDIKLDTNGSNPTMLQKLLEQKLLDFVSLDFKAPSNSHESITHSRLYDNVIQSLELLCKSDIDFEVRTTVHSDLLSIEDIKSMIETLQSIGYTKTYYIQNFQNGCEYLGDIQEQTKPINIEDLQTYFAVEFRNF
jgi:pyruvate formate lyase activating enzyme